MARSLRVAVIGAGIGGLAAACALRRRRIEAQVYERAGELGEVGAGLQLGPNAVKVLRALGIEQALDQYAFEPTNIVSLSWDRAELRFREPLKAVSLARYGARYLTTHRADLHRLLQQELPERSITLGAHCTSAAWRDGTATASFADGRTIEADVIIGADGINSEVRASLFGEQPARWTQQMAWRCMVPIERVPTRVGPGGAVAIGPCVQHSSGLRSRMPHLKHCVVWLSISSNASFQPAYPASNSLIELGTDHDSSTQSSDTWPAKML